MSEPLFGGAAGQRPPGPAGGPAIDVSADLLCWRCGADYPPTSPCTEKRGDGPPWHHAYLERSKSIDPWRVHGYGDAELLNLARYLAGKSLSSLATAKAFGALVAYGDRMGFEPAQRQSHMFAATLYAQKATKRIRLLDWVLDAIDERSQP